MRDGWKMPEKISCEKMRQKIRTGKTAQKKQIFFQICRKSAGQRKPKYRNEHGRPHGSNASRTRLKMPEDDREISHNDNKPHTANTEATEAGSCSRLLLKCRNAAVPVWLWECRKLPDRRRCRKQKGRCFRKLKR